MNKKIIALMTVCLMISSAVFVFVPASDAKTISDSYDQNLVGREYMYCEELTMEYTFKFDVTTFTEGLYVYKSTPNKMNEIKTALNCGNLDEVSGRIESIDPQESGKYIFLKNSNDNYSERFNYYWSYSPEKGSWNWGTMTLKTKIDCPDVCLSMKIPTAKGNSVTVSFDIVKNVFGDVNLNKYLSAFVITKGLMNSIENNQYNVYSQLTNDYNKKDVLASSTCENNNFSLNFTSDGVTDYYVVVVINNIDNANQYGQVAHFKGTITASGLADTANPLPFALILFVLSIALLGVIVYYAKKKVIE